MPLRRRRTKRQTVPMDPVSSSKKTTISLDPSQFSSVLHGVFEAWYKQRFADQTSKTTVQQTTAPTTTKAAQVDKKVLFNEFLNLAMDYFQPKSKPARKSPKVTIPARVSTRTKKTKAKATAKKKVTDPPTTTTRITHPPVLTRENMPKPKAKPKPKPKPAVESPPPTEEVIAPKQTEPAQPTTTKPKKPKSEYVQEPTPQRHGPPIDMELLTEINDLRVLQGLPELRPDQVDQYGNILPQYKPPPPPASPHRNRERQTQSADSHGHSHGHSHSHSHGPHDHYHDHSYRDPFGLGYGTESYIQASLRDTHRRAHQIAGDLTGNMHRELHRLLRNRENNMRREAWQAQQLRQELFGNRPMSGSLDGGSLGGPTIRPVMDLGDMGDLAHLNEAVGALIRR